VSTPPNYPPGTLSLYSVIMPARDEEESLPGTLREIHGVFSAANIPHEIVVVDDGSRDRTWSVLQALKAEIPSPRCKTPARTVSDERSPMVSMP